MSFSKYSDVSQNIDIPGSQVERMKLKDSESDYSLDIKPDKSAQKTPFWTENPNVLLRFPDITEFFPDDSMSYPQKLNAISRTVILMTFIGIVWTNNIFLVIICAITLGAIWVLYMTKVQTDYSGKKTVRFMDTESFKNPTTELLKDSPPSPDIVFDKTTSTNPFSNVLISDYEYNPNKKPAPPSYNENTNEAIMQNAKQMVIDSNPDQPDIADKLFRDLGEQLVFEQSLRPFVSNPSTTIPNDQQAFAEFCYGSMVSCKEGNKFACARNLARYTN
jgi:hypothetical protein